MLRVNWSQISDGIRRTNRFQVSGVEAASNTDSWLASMVLMFSVWHHPAQFPTKFRRSPIPASPSQVHRPGGSPSPPTSRCQVLLHPRQNALSVKYLDRVDRPRRIGIITPLQIKGRIGNGPSLEMPSSTRPSSSPTR